MMNTANGAKTDQESEKKSAEDYLDVVYELAVRDRKEIEKILKELSVMQLRPLEDRAQITNAIANLYKVKHSNTESILKIADTIKKAIKKGSEDDVADDIAKIREHVIDSIPSGNKRIDQNEDNSDE